MHTPKDIRIIRSPELAPALRALKQDEVFFHNWIGEMLIH